jgi:hypothetical protein
MSKDESVELDGDALAMLAMYREEERPSDEVKARVWDRIETGPSVAVVEAVPASTGRSLRWAGLGVAVAAALVLAVIGVQGSRLTADPGGDPGRTEAALQHEAQESGGRAEHREPEAKTPRRGNAGVNPESVTESESESVTESESESVTESVTESESEAGVRRRPVKKAVAPIEPATPETLAAETSLLRRARAALAGGNAGGCLALLSQHARQFPTGVLAEERDALRVVALCSDGRVEDGKKAAATFRRVHPGSPLRGRVDSACTSDEKDLQDG